MKKATECNQLNIAKLDEFLNEHKREQINILILSDFGFVNVQPTNYDYKLEDGVFWIENLNSPKNSSTKLLCRCDISTFGTVEINNESENYTELLVKMSKHINRHIFDTFRRQGKSDSIVTFRFRVFKNKY